MRTRVACGLVVSVCALLLGGCGFSPVEQREPWRAQAEAQCLAEKRIVPTAYIQPLPEIDGPRICGLDKPFLITAFADGAVAIDPNARLGCPVAAALERWLREVVQPAAASSLGVPVAGVRNASSYACRTRNNQRGAKLSEHAFGNALDIRSFTLMDGREISVRSGWRGAPEEQAFLRQALGGACGIFSTVLGPGAPFHDDHFHLDLARHRGRERVYCRPRLDLRQPDPGFDPGGPEPEVARHPLSPRPVRGRDPYAVGAPMAFAADPAWPIAIPPASKRSALVPEHTGLIDDEPLDD